jgi:O-antigen/teichoic acid export membrane protein
MRLGCGLILFTVLAMVQNASLAGLEAFHTIAQINLFRGLIALPLVCSLTLLFGRFGSILGLLMTSAIACLFGELGIRRQCAIKGIRRSHKGCLAELPPLWRFSALLLFCDLIGPPAAWLANALLVQEPGGFAAMGIFSAGMDWMVVAMAVPSLITAALLPVSSELRTTGDALKFASFTARALIAIICLSLVISLGLGLCAPIIIFLYGQSFTGDFRVLSILLASAALANVSNAMRAVAISSDHHKGALASFVVYGGAMIGMMFLLRGKGASGRALSHLSADAALLLGLSLVTVRILRVRSTTASLDAASEPLR